MKSNRIITTFVAVIAMSTTVATLTGCSASANEKVKVTVRTKTVTKKDRTDEKKAVKLEAKNKRERQRLDKLAQKTATMKDALAKQTKKSVPTSSNAGSPANLASLNYTGEQEITINGNKPGFSAAELSTSRGAWESYGNLDGQNRVTTANAMLSQKLMPTSDRTALTWDPTGWHNKRTAHGWLYNRSHLIGFQLSGENNNPKNLMTGTMSLNNPLMLVHEDDLAAYIKASSQHLVRYQVRPVFRGNELVARGVQLRAQSVGSNAIAFNVYIFNVEAGYKIDYNTGYSTKE